MQPAEIALRDRLIVALDLPSPELAEAMIAKLGDSVSFYKIGYQLAYAGGLPLIGKLADRGKKVFADLKMHDIGNTVTQGVQSINKLGAGDFFGEIALVSDTPRTATVTATSPVRALVITDRSFRRLLDESPEIQRKVLVELAERLAPAHI